MSRTRIVIVSSLVAMSALAAVVWWFVFRDTSPAAPTLEGAIAGATSTTGPEPSQPALEGIEGAWSLSGDGTSYVGYRVQEELASIGAKTAVGRTPLVEAALTVEGDRVTSVIVDADLSGLASDDSRRDGAIRRQGLETSTFPSAGFTLTAPITLPAGAASGEPIEVTGAGDLTLHGVTRPVEVALEAQLVDGRIVVVGSLPILFDDFDIEKPSALGVLSVDDHGLMELLLVFELVG
ncbi:MAG: YceI family protein [Actinobacteria bacterium]|nr:YceI family protein [Actinomycetota bacterium]MBU1492533.1 YceI family protein [Actinomycetota bacterium]